MLFFEITEEEGLSQEDQLAMALSYGVALTGFQLLISAGKFLPLILILLHSNTLHKSAAREVKN